MVCVLVGWGQVAEGFAVKILRKSITHSDRPSIADVVVLFSAERRVPTATDYTEEYKPRERRNVRVRVRARARVVRVRVRRSKPDRKSETRKGRGFRWRGDVASCIETQRIGCCGVRDA